LARPVRRRHLRHGRPAHRPEPFWKRAERESFAEVGIDIAEMSRVTAPMTTAQVAAHWYAHRPWQGPASASWRARGRARGGPGQRAWTGLPVRETWAPAAPWARVALASNSPLSLCHPGSLGLQPAFDAIVSAEQVVRGKPAPDIYFAAQRLGVPAGRCLVFGTRSGTHAARQAGMTVIAVPSEDQCFDGAQPAPRWVVPTLVALHGAAGR
jgi:sugar-phosphatase